MRHPDLDFMMVMERRRDELAEAAHSRMVKEAVAGKRGNGQTRPIFRMGDLRDTLMLSLAHFLSTIGGRMLSWSCRLQTRYEMLRQYEMLKDGATEKRISPC